MAGACAVRSNCFVPQQADVIADFLKLNVTGPGHGTKAIAAGSSLPSADGIKADSATQNVTLSAMEVISRALLMSGEVRLEALKVVAVAAANNVPFQQVWFRHQPDVVPWLLMVRFMIVPRTSAC